MTKETAIPNPSRSALSEALRDLTRGSRAAPFQSLVPAHRLLLEELFGARQDPGALSRALGGREFDLAGMLKSSPKGDKQAIERSGGLDVEVNPGERTRLLLTGEQEGTWFHILLRADFSLTSQPVVALRYFAGTGPERVIARFRQTALVLDRRIELGHYTFEHPSLYSFRVDQGRLSLAINGVLVLDRKSDEHAATGYILDVIGGDGPASIRVDGIWVSPPAAHLNWMSADDQANYASAQIAGSADIGTAELGRMLEALHQTPDGFSVEELGNLIDSNRGKDRAYADHVDAKLLERLEAKGASPHSPLPAPPPLLKVSDVTIKLLANPSDKNLRSVFRRNKPVATTILDDLTFSAYSGDIVGIIGKNGAGKSTFLKALVGAIPIASGRIESVTKPILLRPGAGMVGELSGRQNIYKTGLYMDMSMKEIDDLIDDVIDFAELREHIDRPFRYYSDGMRARLIFALATAVPRDILLLDELLSAGDASFQRKAVNRLEAFMSRAKLVLVVQHTFDFVLSRCTKCLLLERGVPVYFGDPGVATELYKESL
ncbi:ABC transporter ATP-binding protein [Devosia oryziradicis]|uniref:ABC transporter ATP-binding protein n=1 Tax=Devosia oryziradicis TaxID=2801335 RepID=A0ABX7C0N5_9HYPH|nr:ATP-binding cassette domain-containing protein [Devosia oryziradicis]QQR36220.1 ABC transporter ATP-binding protein [Devosia oryziradicis]